MTDLVEQIDAMLALAERDALTPRVPHMAIELLTAARDALRRPPVGAGTFAEGIEAAAKRIDDIEALLRTGLRGFIDQGNAVMKQLTEARIDAVRECGRAISALLPSPAAEGGAGWQPIETAPKDGSTVLLTDGDHLAAARWDEASWPEAGNDARWSISDWHNDPIHLRGGYRATYWRPAPPVKE